MSSLTAQLEAFKTSFCADVASNDSNHGPDKMTPDSFRDIVSQASELVSKRERDALGAEDDGDKDDCNAHIPVTEYRLTSGDIVVADDITNVGEYLGNEYRQRIIDLDQAQPVEINCISTTPFPHQERGVAKVMHLFQGPHLGGILGDEMGLGKTLISLVSMWLDGKTRDGCFSLIITKKACVQQWAQEIDTHFLESSRPKYHVLDNPDTTAEQLLKMNLDFVIVTPQFVVSQFVRLREHTAFMVQVEEVGFEAAKKEKRFAKASLSPVKASLFSQLYKDYRLPFKHVAFDEAQWGRDTEGITHQAVKALYRCCTLLISGTFIANRWFDVYHFLDLLPGHPFKDNKAFDRAFSKDRARPPKTQFDNLIRFMMAFTVARPNSVLNLKGATIQHVDFALDDDEEREVTFWIMKWYRTLHALKHGHQKSKKSAEDHEAVQRSMRLVQRAQILACHRLISEQAAADEDQATIKRLVALFKGLIQEHTEKHELSQGQPSEQSAANEGFVEIGGTTVIAPTFDQTTILTHQFLDTEGKDTNVLDSKVFSKVKSKKKSKSKATKKAKAGDDRTAWLKKVGKIPDDELFSTRLSAMVNLILECKEKHPQQKIVVFSRFLKYLDLLREALHRQSKLHDIQTFSFNGQMDQQERELEKIRFAEADLNKLNVLLVTAGAGGAGVNLTSASVVIQAEVWWNRNEELQAWFRVRRPGQNHHVTIYIFMASNSLVDLHMMTTRDRKSEVVQEMMDVLRREDDADLYIPEVVPY